MKKFTFCILVFLAVILSFSNAYSAAGTATFDGSTKKSTGEVVLTYTFTASADNASYPATAISGAALEAIAYTPYLLAMETVPSGTAAPTNLFDVTVTNASSIDLLGGTGMNRSNTAGQRVIPAVMTGIYGGSLVYGTTTINISGNLVNSAVITLRLIFVK